MYTFPCKLGSMTCRKWKKRAMRMMPQMWRSVVCALGVVLSDVRVCGLCLGYGVYAYVYFVRACVIISNTEQKEPSRILRASLSIYCISKLAFSVYWSVNRHSSYIASVNWHSPCIVSVNWHSPFILHQLIGILHTLHSAAAHSQWGRAAFSKPANQ